MAPSTHPPKDYIEVRPAIQDFGAIVAIRALLALLLQLVEHREQRNASRFGPAQKTHLDEQSDTTDGTGSSYKLLFGCLQGVNVHASAMGSVWEWMNVL